MAQAVEFAKVLELAERNGCTLWRMKSHHRIFIHLESKKKTYLPVEDNGVKVFYFKKFIKWLEHVNRKT